ncbi:MAG: ABC transporter ATP-binding protein [Micropruina sp.]|nr:ABC transporter ATP-binding protein [Micropruina sp.]
MTADAPLFVDKRGSGRIDPNDRRQLDESPVQLGRVLGLFRPYRGKLSVLTLIIMTASVVGLAQPFLIKTVIDDALPSGNTSLLIWSVAGMLVVAVITGMLGVVQTWLATSVGQRVMHRLRTDVFAHIEAQALDFFKRTRSGEIQSRLINDIAGLQSVITTTATSVASNLTTAVATAAAMAVLNWRLALISLVVLPPAVLTTRRVALLRRELTGRRQQALAELHGQVSEALSVNGALLTKTLGLSGRRLAEFERTSDTLVDLELRSQLAGRWRMATMQIVFAVIPAVIYLAAGFPQTSGEVSIGTLIAFTTLQVSISRPLLGLLTVAVPWASSLALLSRIFGYLDLPIAVTPPAVAVPLQPADVLGVRLEKLSFRYPDGEEDALSEINLVIPAGHSVGIVGETGSGKSTLAALMVRLADPSAGRITIDGLDLRDLDPDDLARVVGVVSQEAYLVHDTIAANLLLARHDAPPAQLWEALEAAQIADLVRSLPEGLDTVVGSRGHRFSGGERQRLAIARTLLRDPRILVLDEATSSLDNETERELQAALDNLIQGRTTLTIAHRLSTITHADLIVALDRGRIVESGSHNELLESGGVYARLAADFSDFSDYRPRLAVSAML